jgi:putative redox protein
MPTIHTRYIGALRTEATHVASGVSLITDAPLDNQGKGESFSPTDTLCAALTSCMFTIMGIAARTHHIMIDGIQADTTKYMASDPRRVTRIEIRIYGFPETYSDKEKAILQKAAYTCPVALSIHPEIEQDIRFEF